MKHLIGAFAKVQGVIPWCQYSYYSLLNTYGKDFGRNPLFDVVDMGQPGNCYKNAADVAINNDRFYYVEGVIDICGCILPHAWLTDEAGRLIEATDYRDEVTEDIGYYGIVFSTASLLDLLIIGKRYGLLVTPKSLLPLLTGTVTNFTR